MKYPFKVGDIVYLNGSPTTKEISKLCADHGYGFDNDWVVDHIKRYFRILPGLPLEIIELESTHYTGVNDVNIRAEDGTRIWVFGEFLSYSPIGKSHDELDKMFNEFD